MRKVSQIFYTLQYFGAPGVPLHHSSPIWVMTFNKSPVYQAAKFRPVLKTPLGDI